MAIPRPSENWDIIAVTDPAIDKSEKMRGALKKYARLRDIDQAPLLGGQQATIFTLRPLGARCVMRYLKTATSEAQVIERAFRASVIRVTAHRGPNGEKPPHDFIPTRYAESVREARADLFDLFEEDEVELFHPSVISEIGDVASQRAFFPPPTSPQFGLPDMVSRILAMQIQLRAEQESATPKETTSESAPPGQPTTSSSADAGAPGAAAATG